MINRQTLEELQTLWESHQGQEQPKGFSKLPLDSLEILPELYQSRTGYEDEHGIVDRHHVAKLVAALKASRRVELDPIKVLRIGTRNIVVDGHHRLKAYRNAKRQGIPVEWALGSPKYALLAAGAENKKISLPLTSLDRSQRAWTLVALEAGYSKRQIHEGTGASESTIASMRKRLKELQDAGEEIPDTWREAKSGKEPDPDWLEKMVQDWAERITKNFGAPAQFINGGRLGILSDALITWNQRLAQQLALQLVEDLGLQDEAEEIDRIRSEELAEEENEMNDLEF